MNIDTAEDVCELLRIIEAFPRDAFARAVKEAHPHVCPVCIEEQWCSWRYNPLGWIAGRRGASGQAGATLVLRAALAHPVDPSP